MKTVVRIAAICVGLMMGQSSWADARADLLASFDAMQSGKLPFRQEMTVTDKKGRVTQMTVNTIWPDRFHIINPEAKMETIVVPGSTYMKTDGKWSKFPIPMDAMIKAYKPEVMRQQYEATQNVQFVGLQDVNGKKVKTYTYLSSGTFMGIKSNSNVTLHLDASNNLPVRMVVDGEAMKQKSHTEVNYTFDPTLKIVAPN